MEVTGALPTSPRSLAISFSDGTVRNVDFTTAFNALRGYYAKYNTTAAFKKYNIARGNIHWGKDEAVIFPVHDLYTNCVGIDHWERKENDHWDNYSTKWC